MSQLELLMPAGDLQRLQFAFKYGADAVYIGAPLFSLRARENEFDLDNLRLGIEQAHQLGKKVFLTANIFARNLKIKAFERSLKQWAQLKPDALIMSDPGLMMMARQICPEIDIHLSVQANCMNYQSVKFWQSMGVKRIILSRELRLSEIKEIHEQVPDIELEAFVHGSICIAYSGRCLLSHYMSYRDANQGVCDNSCRYGYKIHHAEKSLNQGDYFLEDLRNQGELYPIEEDEHGTYIMNAKDLCLLPHIKELQEAGVVSLKVEGRTKSVYYVAQVARIYRGALQDLEAGRPFNPHWLTEIEKVANRGLHTGFLMGQPTHEAQNYNTKASRQQAGRFAGVVIKNPEGGASLVEIRNRLEVKDKIEIITPQQQYQDQVVAIHQGSKRNLIAAHGGAGVYELELASGRLLPDDALISQIGVLQ